jgi:polyisoprenoid-binding protein YceI
MFRRCCHLFFLSAALGVSLLVSLLFSSPAYAGERYKIDPAHTFSSFEYSHWGLSLQRGRFDTSSGFVELDLAAKTGAIAIVIASASVSTGSDTFNELMRSDSFFDAERYPKILFNSTRLVFDQEKLSQIEGVLTIKDINKAVVVDVSHFACRFMFLYMKQACGANGSTKILRSDYKMASYAPFVSDEITLYFSIEGIRE